MSASTIKNKETKRKQKGAPKLKVILANPNKTRCPILDEEELNHLKLLLKNAIQESELESRLFATKKGICLGLESSLRKINNGSSSCVFISLSIKPKYIIGLIAKNAENKDETQPIYAQPKLENFVEDIFGVQALCMVFPKDLLAISTHINKWVEERKKLPKVKKIIKNIKKPLKKKTNEIKIETPEETKKYETQSKDNEYEKKSEDVAKTLSGDFISFGNANNMVSSKLDGDEAVDALSEIIDKIPKPMKATFKTTQTIQPMDVDSDKTLHTTTNNTLKRKAEESDSDDFLEGYQSLIVHKIKGNPNKKPKKKRKKNKKKTVK